MLRGYAQTSTKIVDVAFNQQNDGFLLLPAGEVAGQSTMHVM